MTGFPPINGSSEGASFILFTQANNISGVYANAAARDVYFGANQSEVDRVAQNEFLIIKLLDNGSGDIAYQQYNGVFQVANVPADWNDISSLVQGETGPGGATGNSYFFPSAAARDTFFNTGSNKALLETGLPIVVNEDSTSTTYQWTGLNSPGTYDSTLFRALSLNSGPGTLFLGSDGTSISSAAKTVNFRSAYGDTALPTGIFFTDKGSMRPLIYRMGKQAVFTATSVFGAQLSPPFSFPFTGTLFNSYTQGWFIRPATIGTVTITAYAGINDTFPEVSSFTKVIQAGDIGNIIEIESPNGLLALANDDQFLKIEGVDLFGGVQTSGAFNGQTKAFLQATIHLVSLSRLLDASDKESFLLLNERGVTASNKTGGSAVIKSATGLSDTFTNATFNAGVDSVSNPSFNTDTINVFSPGDIVLITTSLIANNPDNNCGLFELLSHVGNLATFKGIGLTPRVEDSVKDQFVNVESTGTIQKVEISVMRSGVTGDWEVGKGSSTPIVYTAVSTAIEARILTVRELDLVFDDTDQQIVFDSAQSAGYGMTVNVSGSITANVDGYFHGSLDLYVDKSGGARLEIAVWLEIKPLLTGVWELITGAMVQPTFKDDGGQNTTLAGDIQMLVGDEMRVMLKSVAGNGKIETITETVSLGTITQFAASLSVFRAGEYI